MGAPDQRDDYSLRFRWLGSGPVPASLDLQRCGWILDDRREPCADCIGVIDAGNLDSIAWMSVLSSYGAEVRRFILVTGVKRAHERATLLQIGFGDVVTDAIDIEELSARASRSAELAHWLPRWRRMGDIQLDLLSREAYGRGKPLNLNPREFALLWRLADSPNHAVSKQALIHDVWRMGFVPETNSIAVHMSRLRRKLGFADLKGVIETVSEGEGGYRLRIPDDHDGSAAATHHQRPISGQKARSVVNGSSIPI